VKYFPNGKYYACSLLDNSIRIFYSDSDKEYLSLYGHKLPVHYLSISSDNTLLVTAGNDKNIKIWGTDFGDCKKSILAHS
jgi:U3 small nucleolar RNA-associated protein 12